MEEVSHGFSRFFALMKLLPWADKEELVWRFTGGRTKSLRCMTEEEYEMMCSELRRISGYEESVKKQRAALRKARSGALHQLQLWGVDTSDWSKVNAFVEDKRIAGKLFALLTMDELNALNSKLRAMIRKRRRKEEGGGQSRRHPTS